VGKQPLGQAPPALRFQLAVAVGLERGALGSALGLELVEAPPPRPLVVLPRLLCGAGLGGFAPRALAPIIVYVAIPCR